VQSGVDISRFDLFDEARNALLTAREVEAAAEAESLGAFSLRHAGRGVDALERAQAAVVLVADRPASRSKTYVVANCARLLTVLGFEHAEAIQMAETALTAARELGLPDLEAHCLNTIGAARIGLWDVAGISDLEESLRIGLEHCSPFEVGRIYNNLQSCYFSVGLVEKADETLRASLAMAERIGHPDTAQIAVNVALSDFTRGRWQEACDRIDALGASGVGPGADSMFMEVLLARDDITGAAAACDRAIAGVREDQQDLDAARMLQVFLAQRARIAVAEGRLAAVAALVEESLSIGVDVASTYPAVTAWLTLVLVELGYGDRAALEIAGERLMPWHDVALDIAGGRLAEAAEQLETMGDVTFAAVTRLVALRSLAAQGRRADVAELLPKVLGFYRSVGGTRYVREAEALLPSVA